VRRGYALVHGACLAIDGTAFLLTARTDTGKTTTILKTLDRHPHAFLSDDLTIVCPDGRVLAYPKPLTISRHTVRAVRTPLLSPRERATLVVQSRLHSRSGRRFAMVIARTGLPAATINAFIQWLVPPPKYDVARLVSNVPIAPEAQLAGMVIIQRGGVGQEVLAGDEALRILMENCEDAYGFPPYPTIENALHSSHGAEWRAVERAIVAQALSTVPTTVLRSETMDWFERLPALLQPAAETNGLAVVADNGSHTNGAEHAPEAATHSSNGSGS
jgi:dolichol-phosphate mannosyltransferase